MSVMTTNKKRILFVQHAGVGGALISLSQILRKLDRDKFYPMVLLLRRDSRAVELLRSCGAEVLIDDHLSQFRHVVGGWSSMSDPLSLYFSLVNLLRLKASLSRFKALLERTRPDLVYLNSLPLFHYACVSRSLDIPVVLHVRELILDGFWGLRKRLHRQIIEKCVTRTIFIGESERERLNISSPYKVIPNYVDLDLWRPEAPKLRSSFPYGTILFTGGFNEIKGIVVLVQALALLKPRYPEFRCVVLGAEPPSSRWRWIKRIFRLLGKTPLSEQVLNVVKQAGLRNNCIFKPFVLDTVSEYAQADILIFPSIKPHFPRPVIEAGAMGIPVVASDLPGPRDVVVHGKNGLLVPPNDPTALAAALFELLSNPEQRRKMGALGRHLVRERHSDTINGARILSIIEALCDRRNL